MTTTSSQILDLAGIGAGPFNLSVAALLQQAPAISSRFFESRESVTWHPGMLLDDTHMQTMFLKDLVTPVSPRTPILSWPIWWKRNAFTVSCRPS